jgi:7-cyano-7-deazaguanine synthase
MRLKQKRKVVVLVSGGVDSTTILYSLSHCASMELHPLNIQYGQKQAVREQESLNLLLQHETLMYANAIIAPLKTLDLHELKSLLTTSAMTNDEIPIPDHVMFKQSHLTRVPFRNGIMISIAAAYAETIGASYVYIGTHYPQTPLVNATHYDGQPMFTTAMADAVKHGTGGMVTLMAPFAKKEKSELYLTAKQLGVPFEYAYSCYAGRQKHCGKCNACYGRKKAFEDARIQDPTDYEQN